MKRTYKKMTAREREQLISIMLNSLMWGGNSGAIENEAVFIYNISPSVAHECLMDAEYRYLARCEF